MKFTIAHCSAFLSFFPLIVSLSSHLVQETLESQTARAIESDRKTLKKVGLL
jgi:hypothetical protein